MASTISSEHIDELQEAKILLENPSLTARISGTIGGPLEKAINVLPDSVRDKIVQITAKSLDSALYAAINTLSKAEPSEKQPSNLLHKIGAALTGAAGGAFGLAALAVELPVSTTIMLRSIADIAQSQGENLSEREAQLACIEVFALGGPQVSDDAVDAGYFGVRSALAKAVSDATKHLALHGVNSSGGPLLNKFIHSVAVRFSIPVSEKVAAQAVPIIGAAGGALINSAFIQHFQDIARGHFTVRRLEKFYGPNVVREAYACLPKQLPKSSRAQKVSSDHKTHLNSGSAVPSEALLNSESNKDG